MSVVETSDYPFLEYLDEFLYNFGMASIGKWGIRGQGEIDLWQKPEAKNLVSDFF